MKATPASGGANSGYASDYCVDQVRRTDRDRFVCSLFAPSTIRADLLALYAFNLEVGNIAVTTTEPLIGLMRLQWWRDALDAIFNGRSAPNGNPVAERLAQIIKRHALPSAAFDEMLDVRSEYLESTTLQDEESLVRRTQADVLVSQLALKILEADDAPAVAAGRHVAIAWGILGLARSLPYRRQGGWHPFPRTWLEEAEIEPSMQSLSTAGQNPVLTARLADLVRQYLVSARNLTDNVARPALPALLPATLADTYLRRLRRNGYDLFDDGLRSVGAGTLIAMAWRFRRGQY